MENALLAKHCPVCVCVCVCARARVRVYVCVCGGGRGGISGKKGEGGALSPGGGSAHGQPRCGQCCSAPGHLEPRGSAPPPAAAVAESVS